MSADYVERGELVRQFEKIENRLDGIQHAMEKQALETQRIADHTAVQNGRLDAAEASLRVLHEDAESVKESAAYAKGKADAIDLHTKALKWWFTIGLTGAGILSAGLFQALDRL